ncbi:MAG TPA: magnesium transporter CorA family protein [Pseudonocardiaceae bacterium]|nr:magnesium transporter CorA family protein [Pseudonocardiaceae bacterium]
MPDEKTTTVAPDHERGRSDSLARTPTACPARTRLYRDGALVAEGFPVEQISDHLCEPGVTVWLDLHDPSIEDLAVLTEEFGLHPLAVEDAVHEQQRPKVDRYRRNLFLSAYSLRYDPAETQMVTGELAAFVTSQALITVRKDDEFDLRALLDRWDGADDLAVHGVGFLVHGLLDVIVDSYFVAVQALDDEVEDLEEALFAENSDDRSVQRRSFDLRKCLVLTRRIVLPMREVVNTFMRRDLPVAPEPLRPYFEDVYDHVLRATDWTESLRDMVVSILDTRITLQGNRLNEIMKKLTSWAAIIAVPTAVTGFYGQNVPYPGFQQTWGIFCSVGLMVGIALTLYITFKRKGWL